MQIWQTDEELFELAEKELFTCVVGDVLDKQGLLHQFLPPEIRPLLGDHAKAAIDDQVKSGHREKA